MAGPDVPDGSSAGKSEPVADEPSTQDELDRLWADPPGWWGQLTAVQNDTIGMRLLLTGFFFLLLGGSFDGVLMRMQLAFPEQSLVGAQLYNELFTNHGSVTMFLVILPIFEGFAILLLPLLLGTREMPFPRLGAFAYWTFLLGGLLYYSSTLFQVVPDAGWFAYTPLSTVEFSPDLALDFWVLGLGVAEVGAIAAALEIIIGVLKMRAPGMTLTRMPLFAWALLAMAFMILFAFTPLIIGSLLLELGRGFDMPFFDVSRGGSSAGPVIMITHFLVVYLVAEAGCTAAGQALASFDPPVPAIVTAVATAMAAAACIAVTRWAAKWWRNTRADVEPSPVGGDLQDDELDAFRALGFVGLLLAALSLLTVLSVGISGMIFAGC